MEYIIGIRKFVDGNQADILAQIHFEQESKFTTVAFKQNPFPHFEIAKKHKNGLEGPWKSSSLATVATTIC